MNALFKQILAPVTPPKQNSHMSDIAFSAEQTLNIEYPGRSLGQAREEAGDRMFKASVAIRETEDQIAKLRYVLDHLKQDYHDAVRAANLFDNALDESKSTGGVA